MPTVKNNVSGNILSSDVILLVDGMSIKLNKEAEVRPPGEGADIKVEFTSRLRKPLIIPAGGQRVVVSLSLRGKLLNAMAFVAAPFILFAAYMMLTHQATPLVAIGGMGILVLVEAINFICVRNNRDLEIKCEEFI